MIIKKIDQNSKMEIWLADRWPTVGGSEIGSPAKTKAALARQFFEPFDATAERGYDLEFPAIFEFFKNINDVDLAAEDAWKPSFKKNGFVGFNDGGYFGGGAGITAVRPFTFSPIIKKIGKWGHCSPDGELPAKNIGLEVKCFGAAKHLEAFINDEPLKELRPQLAQYLLAGYKEVYVIHFCPEAKNENLRLFWRKAGAELLEPEIEKAKKVAEDFANLKKKVETKCKKKKK